MFLCAIKLAQAFQETDFDACFQAGGIPSWSIKPGQAKQALAKLGRFPSETPPRSKS
jgi:hypothetical protein